MNFTNSDKIVYFIPDPSRVTQLIVVGDPSTGDGIESKSQSSLVVCIWDKGNPPATGYLADSNGNRLSGSSESGRIEQHLTVHQCFHVLTILCEVVSSERNMSTSLFVECEFPCLHTFIFSDIFIFSVFLPFFLFPSCLRLFIHSSPNNTILFYFHII